jgi:superfamily II DNA or RNA helicase
MHSDFGDYSSNDENWDVSKECHLVTAGKDKVDPQKRVVISTWQSIHKMGKKYFEQFGAVFGDECHLFKAKSLTSIMTKLENCKYRIGTTGTLDGTQCHRLVIEGLFGSVYKVTSTNDLIEKEILSDFEIDCIVLKHSKDFVQKHKRVTYQEELDALVNCDERNNFITNLTKSLKGNTLVLFQYVAKHGRPLYEQIKKSCPEKDVYFIYGGTETDLREKIRKVMEKKDNAVIVASYGTFSTGISIRKLHNIVFASPSKSRIRVLQSIGRQLRKSEHKEKARLYDISDDICWKKYKNHTYRHYEERLKIYENEDFSYNTVVINTNGNSEVQK